MPERQESTTTPPAMLHGKRINLRPIRPDDLDAFFAGQVDFRNRGDYFPLGLMSESKLRSEFAETGLWQREEGCLLIVTPDGEIAGHIEFFKPVNYWDAFELSYLLYGDRFASHGYTTEAVQLVVDYLFGAKKMHRIQLDIVPENAASRRIAEKCGFVLEGTMRGALFNDGRSQDVLIFSLVRDDPRPWRS